MIAHVAGSGEKRGRVVLRLTPAQPSSIAIEAALTIARAYESEIESLFVEDASLLDVAGFPFAQEISFSGRHKRALSTEIVERQMRAAATAMARRMRTLAQRAEVPLHMTIVRGEPVRALAAACDSEGPWNVVVLADPIACLDAATLTGLLDAVPGTTGLIVVGPTAKRAEGRIVALVEDVGDFEVVLRAARRLLAVSRESQITLLLVAESEDEAQLMDEQLRLAIAADETIEILRARVDRNASGMTAEIIRRLGAGFIVGRFGGLVLPREGSLRWLSRVLECPLFLIR